MLEDAGDKGWPGPAHLFLFWFFFAFFFCRSDVVDTAAFVLCCRFGGVCTAEVLKLRGGGGGGGDIVRRQPCRVGPGPEPVER